MKGKWWALPILVVALLSTACASGNSNLINGIAVTGEGIARVTPDVAMVRLGAEVQNDDAARALEQASEIMNRAIASIAQQGIDRKDIRTVTFSVNQRTDTDRSGVTVRRYWVAVNLIQVTVRKIEDTGKVIDVAARAGATRVDSISFTLSDPEAARREARDKAMADAKARAEQLARSGGATLGKIISISEGGGVIPVARSAAPAPVAAAQAAVAPPVEAGETEVRVTVNVVYAIR